LSLKYLKQAESLLFECQENYNPFKKLYVAFAIIYNDMGNIKESKKYYLKVVNKAKKKNDFMTLIAISINMLGMLIDNNKDISKVEEKLLETLKISNRLNEKIYKPHIYYLLGNLYFKKKKYNSSKKNLLIALDLFNEIKSLNMIPEILFSIASLYFKDKKHDLAKKYLFESLEKSEEINDNTLTIKILEKICDIDEKSVLYKQKLIDKLKFVDKYNTKLYSEINKQSIEQLSSEYDLLLKKQIATAAKFEKESKKRQKASQTLRLVSEKEFLIKLIDSLSNQKQKDYKLIQKCKERLGNTKDWNIFMKLFNEINPFFTKYIINKCSNISESELRICNLIKMGFSTNQIAEILFITQRGVEQHRYRIKKKLKLKTDLTIFIRSL
tara:strand:- start:96 stop:1247 length:1152 start_codon:yes stop_codon:yes gene_type:complete